MPERELLLHVLVCDECRRPVDACSCDPQDWVTDDGIQAEPPSTPVEIQP